MKQLPGKSQSTWLKYLTTFAAGIAATVWIIALLPFLVLVSIVLTIAAIPVIYSLKRQIQTGESWQSRQTNAVDITPWHRRLLNTWRGAQPWRSTHRR